jgi:hypothetical protein
MKIPATSIRMAAVDSAPLAAPCRALRVRDPSLVILATIHSSLACRAKPRQAHRAGWGRSPFMWVKSYRGVGFEKISASDWRM